MYEEHIQRTNTRLIRLEDQVASIEKMVLDIHNYLLKETTNFDSKVNNSKPHQFNWTKDNPEGNNSCTYCGQKAQDVSIFDTCPGRG